MRDSGLDEAVGVFEVSKHHLGTITFRFERHPRAQHGFGDEEVGQCSLVSDEH